MALRRTGIKRTPFKRAAEPGQFTSFKSKPAEPSGRKKAMRAVSDKKRAKKTGRATLVGSLAARGVRCEVGPELLRHGLLLSCSDAIQGLHERRKRSSSGSTLIAANLIPACNACNGLIEDRAGEIRGPAALVPEEVGRWLVVREGDEEWESFSVRCDPTTLVVSGCSACGASHVTFPPSGFLPCGHRFAP